MTTHNCLVAVIRAFSLFDLILAKFFLQWFLGWKTSHCLKKAQNVPFEFLAYSIPPILSYQNWLSGNTFWPQDIGFRKLAKIGPFLAFLMNFFHPKCRIWIFKSWHFPPIFDLWKVTCLGTLFDRKFQIFKNSPKLTLFGYF